MSFNQIFRFFHNLSSKSSLLTTVIGVEFSKILINGSTKKKYNTVAVDININPLNKKSLNYILNISGSSSSHLLFLSAISYNKNVFIYVLSFIYFI